jgi:menaquinone-dependent protoporphyrinogen oxidase
VSSILVAYATKYGSTKEVAERVAEALRGTGLAVDCVGVGDVTDLGPYDAVVFGAPFYIGKIPKEGSEFLERMRAALESKPVAFFSLGPVRASDDMAEARQQIDQFLGKLGWFTPVITEMFHGKYDPEALHGLDKLLTKPKASPLHGVPASDAREWDAIEAWAQSLPGVLLSA